MNPDKPRDLDMQSFDATIAKPGIVFIDRWAPWCGPCRAFAPVFERTAAKAPDATFAKVNTEAQPDLAAEFEIRSIPTLRVIRDGVMLYNRAGMLPATALDQLLTSARAVDMAAVRRHLARESAAADGP